MARAIVTQEAVEAAAQQLVDAGEEPGIVAVQAKIGGGSFSTVKRYLDSWKAQRQVKPAMPAAPDQVQQRAVEFARVVWQEAAAIADRQIAQARAEADDEIAQARAAELEAEQVVAQLEAEAEARVAELTTTRQERDAARAALEATQRAAQVAEMRLEEQAQRLADLQRQVEAQAAELVHARAELLAQARLVGEVEALRRQVADAPPPKLRGRRPAEGD
jgi:hypothetical protein